MCELPTLDSENSPMGNRNGDAGVPGVPCTRHSVSGDGLLAIRAEFVAVGGPDGESLAANQLVVIQEILLWLHRHTAPKVLGE